MDKNQEQIKPSQPSEVQIKIPDTGGSLTVEDVKKEADSKFKDINYILLSVIIIMIIMVATLVIDSFHINSATYKEYSIRTRSLDDMQRTYNETLDNNALLIKQNNINQELIINQQKQILELIKKNNGTP